MKEFSLFVTFWREESPPMCGIHIRIIFFVPSMSFCVTDENVIDEINIKLALRWSFDYNKKNTLIVWKFE